MQPKTRTAVTAALFLILALIASFSSLMASDTITIVAEVNVTNQIVADGVIYEVDDTPQGNELLTGYISQKVEVTGSLRIEGDMRIITVKSFKVVKE